MHNRGQCRHNVYKVNTKTSQVPCKFLNFMRMLWLLEPVCSKVIVFEQKETKTPGKVNGLGEAAGCSLFGVVP